MQAERICPSKLCALPSGIAGRWYLSKRSVCAALRDYFSPKATIISSFSQCCACDYHVHHLLVVTDWLTNGRSIALYIHTELYAGSLKCNVRNIVSQMLLFLNVSVSAILQHIEVLKNGAISCPNKFNKRLNLSNVTLTYCPQISFISLANRS